MRPCLTLLLAIASLASFLSLPTTARAADAWGQLKVGMTRKESTAVLGNALLTTRGRGFEIATYDQAAEVVYLGGRVITWTAPAASFAPAAPAEAWAFNQVRLPRGTRRIITPAVPIAPARRDHVALPSFRLK